MKDMRFMSRNGSIDDVPEAPAPDTETAQEESILEPLLTPQEIAKALGVSCAMVYKLVREGKLEGMHVGRLVRIRPEAYWRYLDEYS